MKGKLNIRFLFSLLLVIIWMCIIFIFSNQVGDSSSQTSGGLIRKIITMVNSNITNDKLDMIVEFLQPFTRKLAHFTIYTIGGILIYNLGNYMYKITKKRIIFSIGLGSFYAVTDEIHQYFVPGRSCRFFDIFLDSCGVIFGICIYIVVRKIIMKIKIKKVK